MTTPNNIDVYTAAFAGAEAGMSFSDRSPQGAGPPDYTGRRDWVAAMRDTPHSRQLDDLRRTDRAAQRRKVH
jgi:hypothetical protein